MSAEEVRVWAVRTFDTRRDPMGIFNDRGALEKLYTCASLKRRKLPKYKLETNTMTNDLQKPANNPDLIPALRCSFSSSELGSALRCVIPFICSIVCSHIESRKLTGMRLSVHIWVRPRCKRRSKACAALPGGADDGLHHRGRDAA